jgi:hypothetical protein
MRPRGKRRLVTGLVSVVGAASLVMGILAAPAMAAPDPGPPLNTNSAAHDGPQTANIPYVAWIGEHVRLVVCDPSIKPEGSQWVNFQGEDWSGYPFQPPAPDGAAGSSFMNEFNPGPAAFFLSSQPAHAFEENESTVPEGCVATDYKSLDPGLARIRVVVRETGTDAIVFSHQFLVIWLVADPVLHEAGLGSSGTEVFQNELSPKGHEGLKKFIGDPGLGGGEGTGEFPASPWDTVRAENEDLGLVQIKVTGNFPVEKGSPLSNVLPNPSYTLPRDWVTLADALATSSVNEASEPETEPPGSNPGLWDIHGTPAADPYHSNPEEYEEGEAPLTCTTGTPGPHSATDNCNGTGLQTALESKFSRVFGDVTFNEADTATIGPFDPQAANETLLSDGRLNEDDAPMPALRVDVSIARNTQENEENGTDLGGVGQLEEADKSVIYSHDFNGASTAHNLYNPYYGEYIPSTARPGVNEASGIDGPSPGGDFPGFVNKKNPYKFWEFALEANERKEHSTGCLLLGDYRDNIYYQTPSGPLTKTVYTDERGEAYVVYNPGDQFYLEHLYSPHEEQGKILRNANGGCDLEGVFKHTIGESSITATGIYPYEPVDYLPAKSAPLVKKVYSLWEKEFFDFPKTEGPSSQYAFTRVVVAKAQNIDGYPIVHDLVCFYAGGAGIRPFAGTYIKDEGKLKLLHVKEELERKPVYAGGSLIVEPPGFKQDLCETTNRNGLAAIDVTESINPTVDMNVYYPLEKVERDHLINITQPSASTFEVGPGSPSPATSAGASGVTGATPAVAPPAVVKPLTPLQQLHKQLNACKKQKSKKKRVACEVQARKTYAAKLKSEQAKAKKTAAKK